MSSIPHDNLILYPGGNIDLSHALSISDRVLIVLRYSKVRRFKYIPKWLLSKKAWIPIAVQCPDVDDILLAEVNNDNNLCPVLTCATIQESRG